MEGVWFLLVYILKIHQLKGGLLDVAVSYQRPESDQYGSAGLDPFSWQEKVTCIFTSICLFLSSPPLFLPLQ